MKTRLSEKQRMLSYQAPISLWGWIMNTFYEKASAAGTNAKKREHLQQLDLALEAARQQVNKAAQKLKEAEQKEGAVCQKLVMRVNLSQEEKQLIEECNDLSFYAHMQLDKSKKKVQVLRYLQYQQDAKAADFLAKLQAALMTLFAPLNWIGKWINDQVAGKLKKDNAKAKADRLKGWLNNSTETTLQDFHRNPSERSSSRIQIIKKDGVPVMFSDAKAARKGGEGSGCVFTIRETDVLASEEQKQAMRAWIRQDLLKHHRLGLTDKIMQHGLFGASPHGEVPIDTTIGNICPLLAKS